MLHVGARTLLVAVAVLASPAAGARTQQRVLLTGFDAFGGLGPNSSWEAIKELEGKTIAGATVSVAKLPVVYGKAGRLLKTHIERVRPDLVVCFGMAAGRRALSIEMVADGFDRARSPDNAGVVRFNKRIVSNGPAFYLTRLDVKAIGQALGAARIAAYGSSNAGAYLCNHVFYHLMHNLAETDRRGGFVHLPAIARPKMRGWPIERLRKAVRTIVATQLLAMADRRPAPGTQRSGAAALGAPVLVAWEAPATAKHPRLFLIETDKASGKAAVQVFSWSPRQQCLRTHRVSAKVSRTAQQMTFTHPKTRGADKEKAQGAFQSMAFALGDRSGVTGTLTDPAGDRAALAVRSARARGLSGVWTGDGVSSQGDAVALQVALLDADGWLTGICYVSEDLDEPHKHVARQTMQGFRQGRSILLVGGDPVRVQGKPAVRAAMLRARTGAEPDKVQAYWSYPGARPVALRLTRDQDDAPGR